jgi:hypothetical protein
MAKELAAVVPSPARKTGTQSFPLGGTMNSVWGNIILSDSTNYVEAVVT